MGVLCMSWMSKDISKPGVKIRSLKSPVNNTELGRCAEVTLQVQEAFLVLMHKKTQRYTFHQPVQMAVISLLAPLSQVCSAPHLRFSAISFPGGAETRGALPEPQPRVHAQFISTAIQFIQSVSPSFIIEPHAQKQFHVKTTNRLLFGLTFLICYLTFPSIFPLQPEKIPYLIVEQFVKNKSHGLASPCIMRPSRQLAC